MYRIIGGDQTEYGPVSADDVRRWIAEGRLNAASRARAEGEPGWKALGEFPEFAGALAAHNQPPPLLGGTLAPPGNTEIYSTEILAREPSLPIGLCLSRSLDLLKTNFGVLFTATLLLWLVSLVQFIPFVSLGYKVLEGVLYGGLCLVFLKRIRGEPTAPGEVFAGFNIAFGQLLLVGVIIWVLTEIGFCLCILPGVFLVVAWIFAVPLVIDKRLEFWSAMELSRKVVSRVWFAVFLLLVICFAPVIVMRLAATIKAITHLLPVYHEVLRSGPQDLGRILQNAIQINAATFALTFVAKVVVLFTLPFAVGALMYAYEILFGPRTAPAA